MKAIPRFRYGRHQASLGGAGTARRSTGVALVVVLMFLLVISSLAIFSARYATMGESMSRNQLDAEKARQAAETALRDAERDLIASTAAAGAACNRGVYPIGLEAPRYQATCPQGLCDGAEANILAANWTGAGTNPEAWWSVSKGGQWNNATTKGRFGNCTFDGGVPLGSFTNAALVAGVARQPEYLIERFSRQSGRLLFFRITARGFGASETTQVVLQTYYRPFTAQ